MNKLTAKYYSGLLTQGIVAIYVLLCVDVSRAENHGVMILLKGSRNLPLKVKHNGTCEDEACSI